MDKKEENTIVIMESRIQKLIASIIAFAVLLFASSFLFIGGADTTGEFVAVVVIIIVSGITLIAVFPSVIRPKKALEIGKEGFTAWHEDSEGAFVSWANVIDIAYIRRTNSGEIHVQTDDRKSPIKLDFFDFTKGHSRDALDTMMKHWKNYAE